MSMKFKQLVVGDTFDFIEPGGQNNSFFKRCEKISSRLYLDDDGFKHEVGSINAKVYHVNEED